MSYEQVSKDLEKVIGYIHSDELTDDEKKLMTEQTLDYFDNYVSPGWLKYRKSVSTNSAVLEWKDHDGVCDGLYGEEFIDCLGGFGIYTCGHRNPEILDTVKAQLDHQALHSQELLDPLRGYLAKAVADITPGDLQYCFFTNGGAKAIRNLIAVGEKVAAMIVEPIQGEAGVIVPPEGYLTELRQICDEYGVALIFDEIQTGMGRTGTMWRCEAEGVTPDIMTFGKAFGGGIMPITGIICKPSMWVQQLIDNPWLLGSPTFGGNPVCCSAAIATIKYMIDNDIPGQCASKGKILKAGLESLKAKYPEIIDDVRGVGLMLAVEFVTSDIGYSIAKGLFSRGVMTAGTLVNSKCIRFEPTAVITEEQIAAVIERMDAALADTKKEYNL